jgi:hypothetical protein
VLAFTCGPAKNAEPVCETSDVQLSSLTSALTFGHAACSAAYRLVTPPRTVATLYADGDQQRAAYTGSGTHGAVTGVKASAP